VETQSEQEKMDQLMAELQGEVAAEAPAAAAADATGDEAGESDAGLSEQEKMDQLMAELQGDAGSPETADPAPAAAPEGDAPDADLSEQEKMDRLMAELQGGGGAGPQAESPESESPESESPESESPEEESPEEESPEEELSEQEKMDRLMSELQGNGNGGEVAEPATPESDAEVEPDEDVSDQEKMDRLMAELQGDAGIQKDADTDADEDADEADDEFQSLDENEADLDGYTEDDDTFESLDDGEEDLDGYGDEDADAGEQTEPVLASAAEPEPPVRRKPVSRERKSLFKIQEEPVSALPESARRGPWPRIVLVSLGVTILLAALFAGLTVYKNRGVINPDQAAARPEAEQPRQPASAAQPEASASLSEPEEGASREVLTDSPANSIIKDRFETIDTLRQSLQIKQAEITKLKKEYEDGIAASMEVVAGLAAEHQIKDLKDALAVRRIAFELQTMQRRKAYIRKLDGPYNRLLSGSEALLYIKRLTEVDLAVAPFAGGLGTGRLLKRIDAEIDRHQLTRDKLLVAADDTGVPELEALWQAALIKTRKVAASQPAANSSAEAAPPVEEVPMTNNEIWAQICNGNPDNKYRLTELTTEAAACLAKWKGKELFLNRLTTLTSRQARALAQWEGEWIGLNSLTEMDRTTARALFKWRGKRLSLNGFAEVPPGIARYLAKWKGKQLELMGLELLSHKTAVYFAEWKKSGGQLYIPNKFYRRK
jgi:hypothetical protein